MNKCLSIVSGAFASLAATPAYASDSFALSLFISPLIIGLILSALFMLRQLKLNSRFREAILCCFAIGAIIQLFAIDYATEFQRALILFGSSIVWVCLYISDRMYASRYSAVVGWQDKLVAAVTCGYALALLMLPTVNGYLVWVGFGVFIIVMSIIALRAKFKALPRLKQTELFVLSTFGVYLIVGYLWLNTLILSSIFMTTVLVVFIGFLWGKITEAVAWQQQREGIEPEEEQPISRNSLDPITNLPNYQHAVQKLKLLNHKMLKQQYVAIVFKPVNFQEVNRVLGHQTSDILLLQLAYSLQKSVCEKRQLVNFNDSNDAIRIARLQGLEFLAVIDTSHIEHSTYIEVEETCKQLLLAVPKALSFKSFSLNFDLVFGVAASDAQFSDIEQLIKYANDALLEGERLGRQITYFDYKTTIFAEQQLQNMEKLKLDIERERLDWVIYPQVLLPDNRLAGVKLACEWRGLNGDVLSKEAFREVAEFSGEIYPLTKITLKKAFELLEKLHKQGQKCHVAVELSSVELLQPELIEYITSVADNIGISTKYLMLDIDETLLLAASERTQSFIEQMKTSKVSIAIDNFSGSYESLRYLRRTIVGQVKIDCKVLNEQRDGTDKIIIDALINLIRKMGIALVATHIDTLEARDTYVSIGGTLCQGRVINRRLPLDKFEDWFKDWLVKHPIIDKD